MKNVLLISLAALLAGCAPSQTGGGTAAPQVMNSALSPVAVKPGQTLYVQYTYPRSLVKVKDQYFSALVINFRDQAFDNVRSVSAAAPWLSMKAQNLPEGVDVSLSRAQVLKDIVKTSNSNTGIEVNYYERLLVTLKVTASAAAPASASRISTLMYSDGGTHSEVPLFVRVEGPESRTANLP